MSAKISTIERRARYVMGMGSVVVVLSAMAFKSGLISTAPTYDFRSWYLVSEHTGFLVTSVYADEAQCRSNQKPSSVCRSGKSLIDEERSKAPSAK